MAATDDEARPSQVTDQPWLRVRPDGAPVENDPETAGKWMVFPPVHLVDVEWRAVRRATQAGRLGIEAKVATAYPNPLARSRDERPIMVYTRDWRDRADVERVLIDLREIGIASKAFYKRDTDTREGHYGGGVTVYVSPPGATWFEDRRAGDAPTDTEPRHVSSARLSHIDAARPVGRDLPSRPQEVPGPPLRLPAAVATAFAEPRPLLEDGASVRLYGDVWDPEDGPERMRRRCLPALGGPGVTLDPQAVARIVEALREGAAEAAEVFLDEFGECYGFWPEVGTVRWLRVWPAGTPEPT